MKGLFGFGIPYLNRHVVLTTRSADFDLYITPRKKIAKFSFPYNVTTILFLFFTHANDLFAVRMDETDNLSPSYKMYLMIHDGCHLPCIK